MLWSAVPSSATKLVVSVFAKSTILAAPLSFTGEDGSKKYKLHEVFFVRLLIAGDHVSLFQDIFAPLVHVLFVESKIYFVLSVGIVLTFLLFK